jgi:hypothetical protein
MADAPALLDPPAAPDEQPVRAPIVYDGPVLARRRFLFLAGKAPGLWLAGAGLLTLQRRFVVALGGSCSFCGKDGSEVSALAGITGRGDRICEGCVRLCWEILAEQGLVVVEDADARTAPPPTEDAVLDELGDLLRGLDAREREPGTDLSSLMADLRRRLDGERRARPVDFSCSFCDALRRDVPKLISGPRVFICDGCVGDAAGLLTQVIRA